MSNSSMENIRIEKAEYGELDIKLHIQYYKYGRRNYNLKCWMCCVETLGK
jgi:hypothetical protein